MAIGKIVTALRGRWKQVLLGATLAGGIACLGSAAAAQGASAASIQKPVDCSTGPVDPYKNYACLDKYLGDDVVGRFFNYYQLEWGKSGAPSDPNAPPSRRDGWPATPETTPPMPFTEWPYGAATAIGVTRPSSVDSPLMAAIANTGIGRWMNDNHFQVYGWLDGGFNVSSNSVKPGGNAPIAYAYTPNTVQLDQTVLYLDRFPDTVQTDHIDWGMRLSAIYGENYRYTTAYGIASYQLLRRNNVNGYDFPMAYVELWVPQIAEGLLLRAGRYISIPDIEAQLAPNNYMYTHSLSYAFDNYTNEGVQATLAVRKNLLVQLSVNVGTEAAIWHAGQRVPNPVPGNPLYPGTTFLRDPGAQPSLAACIRWTSESGDDTFYPCMDGINNGNWGYNNLQWYGFTYYHKFSDRWHVSYEFYDLHQRNVPNLNNPVAADIYHNGGTPFSPPYILFNQPGGALCDDAVALTCRATAIGTLAYINYSPDALNNFSLRPEFYSDEQGQRTGTKAHYYEISLGWQHWFSPQLEIRPEIGWYESVGGKAFNAGTKNTTLIGAMDAIVHF